MVQYTWVGVGILFGLQMMKSIAESQEGDGSLSYPSVLVSILARNKAHTLPYFLGLFEDLDYPKNRLHLFIRTDHNLDETVAGLAEWVEGVRSFYGSVDFELPTEGAPTGFADEQGPFDWSEKRFRHLIGLKEESLYKARKMQMDYILFLDCDQFLVHQRALQHLMWTEKPIVAPVMKALESNYSNFWAGISPEGYYQRTEEYIPILYRQKTGTFSVPMVHSVFLVDLRSEASKRLTFDPDSLSGYSGPTDDLLVFAQSAKSAGIEMEVLNTLDFGILLEPSPEGAELEFDVESMRYLMLESQFNGPPGLLHSPFCRPQYPEPGKVGFDEVYLINLDRRTERRERMESCFRLLGIQATHWSATDGTTLTDEALSELGIRMLPEYADPYHKRPLTMGEIGCFLSHYRIWKEVVERGYKKVLVFEDDLRFIKYFRPLLAAILEDAESTDLDWELIYLGRKRLDPARDGAEAVPGSRYLTTVSYSYWTLAYALTFGGAKKLLDGKPLEKLVPVDEYLPIMFNQHPEAGWMSHFAKRDLKAFTAEPLLVYPTHYTGDSGYISDTENATVIEKATETEESALMRQRGEFQPPPLGEFQSVRDEL